MKNANQNFDLLKHPNGTSTLVDAENGQAMHSRIGPAQEAEIIYADSARIEERLRAETTRHVLYDVGLGTGANVVATLERIRRDPHAWGRLDIYSFETKPEGLLASLANLASFPNLAPWESTLRMLLEHSRAEFEIGNVRISWTLVVGDFYARVAESPAPDTIYFDFYSPKIVPELWSLEKFDLLRAKIGGHRTRLFTYTSSTPVRLHLFAAGFYVGGGAQTRAKLATTIAATEFRDLENPTPRRWLKKLEISTSIQGAKFEAARERALNSPQWAALPSDC
jgi:tRNA U34 5-methylaminomethyl-2-thiouridine-forming methyltransferase MnmC